MTATTRGGALRRGLLFAAGLLGLGAAGEGAAASAVPRPRSLVLYGRGLDGHGHGGTARRGDRLTVVGELLDRPGGNVVGELYGAVFTLRGPTAVAPDADRLELHTFQLRDGSIIGSGTAGAREGAFAILGGTGAYAGARGVYTTRHDRSEHGGAGTAKFHLTLTMSSGT